MAYDPYSKIYNVKKAAAHVTQIALALVLAGMAVVPFLRGGSASRSDLKGLLTYWAILLALSLGPVYRLVRSAGGPCRVLANHLGVRFEYPDAAPLEIGWGSFDVARFGWFSQSLTIRGQNGQQLLRRRDRRIGAPQMRRKLATDLNELAAAYRAAPEARAQGNAPT